MAWREEEEEARAVTHSRWIWRRFVERNEQCAQAERGALSVSLSNTVTQFPLEIPGLYPFLCAKQAHMLHRRLRLHARRGNCIA